MLVHVSNLNLNLKLKRHQVFVCWAPFYFLRVAYNFGPDELFDECRLSLKSQIEHLKPDIFSIYFSVAWFGSMALANINSILNPILYAGMNKRSDSLSSHDDRV